MGGGVRTGPGRREGSGVHRDARLSVRTKTLVLVAAVVVFSAGGVASVSLFHALEREHELLDREGAHLARAVSPVVRGWLAPGGARPGAGPALEGVLREVSDHEPVARAWVVDGAGRVVACSAGPGACPPGLPTPESRRESTLRMLEHLVRPVPHLAGAWVREGDRTLGAVRLAYDATELSATGRRLALGAAGMALGWTVVGLLFALVLVHRVTGPLRRLVAAAHRLAEGEEGTVAVSGDLETAELQRAFNHLSDSLRARRAENEAIIATLEERVTEASREMLRVDRLATLGAIAAGFAHELGNAMHVVNGYTRVLRRELEPDDPHRADVAAIEREMARTHELLQRFLVFARARDAQRVHQPLGPLVGELVALLGPTARDAGVDLQVVQHPALPELEVDGELLRQALLNLSLNGFQAMSQGGTLTLRLTHDASWVEVSVEDTGPGVPEALRERIFEPFFTSRDAGTGLGLAIVRHAAEAHGGRVEVGVSAEGGAAFRLFLPRRTAAPAEAA